MNDNLLGTPFDVINLPSLGVFYSDKRSNIMVRHLTGNDEVFLTSPTLLEMGTGVNLMLNSVILDEVNIDEFMLCDKHAVLIFLKSTTYGDEIKVNVKCPHCSKSTESSFRLSEIEVKEVEDKPNEEGMYSFTLPKFKIKSNPTIVKFKPITVAMNNKVGKELISDNSEIQKISTTRMKYQIQSINENSDINYIEKVIKNMPIIDFSALKDYIQKVEPGFNEDIKFDCGSCQKKFTEKFYIDDNFLGLTPTYRTQVMEECFLAYYYGKGITRKDAYDMTVLERRWTVNRISEEIEKKNKAEQDAMNKAKSKRK